MIVKPPPPDWDVFALVVLIAVVDIFIWVQLLRFVLG